MRPRPPPATADAQGLASRLGRFTRPGLPKYVALHDAVVDAVNTGEWPSGTRLPNEQDLAARLPIALGTIQRALRQLVQEGVIVRRSGHGTFVAPTAIGRMNSPLHCRFVDDTGRDYLPVRSQFVAREEVARPGPWRDMLGAGRILMIERLMHIGDEFRLVSRIFVRPDVLPVFEDLPPRKLDGENFKDLMWRHSGQAIGAVQQFLTVKRLPDAAARRVGVRRGTVGAHLEAFAWSTGGTPLYFQEFWIPPNARRLHLPANGRDPGLLAGSGRAT